MNIRAIVLLTAAISAVGVQGQANPSAVPANVNSAPSPVDRSAAGDSPVEPGPLATGLSGDLKPADISKAMQKVTAWQVSKVGLGAGQAGQYNQQWTYAALYDGLLAYSRATKDATGHDAVLRMAEHFDWKLLDTRFPHADDEALGQAYLDLYAEKRSPERIANTKAVMDRLVARADDAAKPVWWWCDALFMAPPVLVRLAKVTGDRKYIAYMDHEWGITTAALYDSEEHLYFRDERFLKQQEKNGRKLFWARGNGWVLAGLANVLEYLPAKDPLRPKYEKQFKEMAAKIASLQGADGLWRTGLLDAESYKLPEVSGSAFFTYGMAWGVNHGLLPRKEYEPVVRKSWAAMVGRIYEDGRLGSIQPIGAAPDSFQLSSSYVYGVGGFLLAGAELEKMAAKR